MCDDEERCSDYIFLLKIYILFIYQSILLTSLLTTRSYHVQISWNLEGALNYSHLSQSITVSMFVLNIQIASY